MAIITFNNYTGDGATRLFSFTFPYTTESSIKVSVDGILLTPITEYILANATTISFVTAPANGTKISIYRRSPKDDLLNTFFPGSAIRAGDLNDNFTQSLYLLQEFEDYANDASGSAEDAIEAARAAAESAAIAEAAALQAQADASEASSKADDAQESAESAARDAQSAQESAEQAASDASDALSTSEEALSNINEAVDTANAADAKANTALSNSSTALSNASTALTTSNQALTTANNALGTAEESLETVDAANDKADTAIIVATNALSIVDEVTQNGEPFGTLYNITSGTAGSKVIDLGDLSELEGDGHFPNENTADSKYTCSKGTGVFNLGAVA